MAFGRCDAILAFLPRSSCLWALGIGTNTAVFSLMDAVMLRMLPVSDPERLVIFAHRGDGEPSTGSNYPLYEALRTGSQSFAGVLAFWQFPMKLRLGDERVSVDGQFVTTNYFSKYWGSNRFSAGRFPRPIPRTPSLLSAQGSGSEALAARRMSSVRQSPSTAYR